MVLVLGFSRFFKSGIRTIVQLEGDNAYYNGPGFEKAINSDHLCPAAKIFTNIFKS